jgi:hypothetical protein
MYRILIFYTIIFSILLSKINFKMVKSEIVVLSEREKANADRL